jgi:WD40 repeat protein
MVRLWDVVKNREIAKLQHETAVTQLAFSAKGKYLAILSRLGQEKEEKDRNATVKIWETETGKEISRIQQNDRINAITFSPRFEPYLLTGSSDNTARLWDVVTGKEELRTNHGSTVELVNFLKFDKFPYLITAGNDSLVRIWGLYVPKSEELPPEQLRLLESPNIMVFAHNISGQYLATISHDLNADASMSPEQYVRDLRVWTIESIRNKLRLDHDDVV